MCGIIGYVGAEAALGHLTEGLERLAYRGYDSAGVAVALDGGNILTVKAGGRLEALRARLREHPEAAAAHCGIGHTRWATHGRPTERNAHPHTTAHLSLVHNGIIENEAEWRERLTAEGVELCSETDTEVAAWLIDRAYAASGDPIGALLETARLLRGSFAFAVLFHDRPDALYAMRRDSPLLVAHGEGGAWLASDMPALLGHVRRCMRLPEGMVARLGCDGVACFGHGGEVAPPPTEEITQTVEQAQRGGYAHFMRKEIGEQPEALRRTVGRYVRDGLPCFPLPDSLFRRRRVRLIACGTAMHAGLLGRRMLERLARLPAEVEIASEFRYRDPILAPDEELCILLSQSGETADTLAALRHVKALGVPTLAIVNAVGSTIAAEADHVLYTPAGPEIAVASTKAYSVQCAVLLLLALRFALLRGEMGEDEVRAAVAALAEELPKVIEEVLAGEARVAELAREIARAEHLFFIGRRVDADICSEGSLKLKEISYIHSEAYPAGELKHGTLSLVEEGVPVVAVMTEDALCDKMLSAVREVAARGARVLAVVTAEIASHMAMDGVAVLALPKAERLVLPFAAVVVLQLLAYHAAVVRGCDVDRPRNLAKAVTVE